MKIRFLILKIYSSIFKRIHSWGLLILIGLVFLSSIGLKFQLTLTLFGRLGLMSLHLFCGFLLVLFFTIISYNYILTKLSGKQILGDDSSGIHSPPIELSGKRLLVDKIFYVLLSIVCLLGLLYYFIQAFSIDFYLFNQNAISLLHVIFGWFFISIVLIKYYLTFISWFVGMNSYLRDN